MELDFLDYKYYPTLRTRHAELSGLKHLAFSAKEKILPILTLGEWPRSKGVERSIEKSNEAFDSLPFIADLTTTPAYSNNALMQEMKDHSNAFKNWRKTVLEYENIIPVVQFSTSRRDFIQQALLFESENRKIVFRIKYFSQDTEQVIYALSAMNDIANALVVIDCQYIRDSMVAYVAATISTINSLRREFPSVGISVLSTSFPSSVIDYSSSQEKEDGIINILELDLFNKIGGEEVAIYGDHGSIHSVVYDPSVRIPVPRIDYPTETTWYFERRNYDDSTKSYEACAESMLSKFPEIANPSCWGEEKILEASQGNVFSKGAASWISVRTNIHITKQIEYHSATSENFTDNSDGSDLDEWL